MPGPKNPLSLHHLTVMDASAPDLVDIAAAVGCPYVGVFVRGAGRGRVRYPVIAGEAALGAVRERLDATGVRVHNLEVFALGPDTDPAAFEPALEAGASLRADRLTAVVVDPELGRARERFDDLCARAARHGLAVHLEFHGFGEVRTLKAARAFLKERRPANASLALDVLHIYRNDGNLDGLDVPDSVPVGYAQINDGPLAIDPATALDEALEERGVPGTGAFDLPRFVAALPDGIVLDVEVPSRRLRDAGMGPLDRARHIVEAARRIMGPRAA